MTQETFSNGLASARVDHPRGPQATLPRNRRPKIRWPEGARVAFWVAPNVEFYQWNSLANPKRAAWPRPFPDTLHHGFRDYGNRVGNWRCLDVFDAHKIVGSVSLNSAMCKRLPEIVSAYADRGWELFCHGEYNTSYLYGMDPKQEQQFIEDCCEQIETFSGQQVTGFLSPALSYNATTFESISRTRIRYVLDLFDSDVPVPLRSEFGRRLSVPYQVELNDFHALVQGGLSPRQYVDRFKAHFDRLYDEGQDSGTVVGLPLHPYIIGSPQYIGALDEILAHVRNFPNVWHTRAGDICDFYMTEYFDEAVKAAEEEASQ